jgi:hypothetical protein
LHKLSNPLNNFCSIEDSARIPTLAETSFKDAGTSSPKDQGLTIVLQLSRSYQLLVIAHESRDNCSKSGVIGPQTSARHYSFGALGFALLPEIPEILCTPALSPATADIAGPSNSVLVVLVVNINPLSLAPFLRR